MNRNDVTAGEVRAVLDYDQATGKFYWKARTGKRSVPGSPAGTVSFSGYLVITIWKTRFYAHRLAWLMVTGEWPSDAIDHRNGLRADNRWENLRIATPAQNQQNRGLQSNNKSGHIGVSRASRAGEYWRAGIRVAGQSLNLGDFRTVEEAGAAYRAAKAELHAFQPVPRG